MYILYLFAPIVKQKAAEKCQHAAFIGKRRRYIQRFNGPSSQICTQKAKIQFTGMRLSMFSSVRPRLQSRVYILIRLEYRHITGHIISTVKPVRMY